MFQRLCLLRAIPTSIHILQGFEETCTSTTLLIPTPPAVRLGHSQPGTPVRDYYSTLEADREHVLGAQRLGCRPDL